MTVVSPSATPFALSTAGSSGAPAMTGVGQGAVFATVFGDQPAFPALSGLGQDTLPAMSGEVTETFADGVQLSDTATLETILPEGGELPELPELPELTVATGMAESQLVPTPVRPDVTDLAANLLRMRLDVVSHASATQAEAGPVPPRPVKADNAMDQPATLEPGQVDVETAARLQAGDIHSGRNRAAGRSDKADTDKPAPAVPAIAPAEPGFDVPFGAFDPSTSGDALLNDTGTGGGDPTAPQATQDVRRSGGETVMLHRAANAPPPAERQILAAISATPSGRTEILLDPQDLGRVRLSLEGDESSLVLTIQAERADTADLLRRNADLLLQEFQEAGYQNLTFTFSDQHHAADDRQPAGADFGTDDAPLSAELVADPSPGGPSLVRSIFACEAS